MRHSLIATTFIGTTLVNGGSALAPVRDGPIAAEITETVRVPALSDGFAEAQPQRFHVVRRGETLWGIAQQELGNAARWPEIFAVNRDVISNPNVIFPGQVVSLPRAPIQPPPVFFHVVRRGDTLSSIAQQELGDAGRWPEIFSRNRNIIRNPHRIFPGQVLVVR